MKIPESWNTDRLLIRKAKLNDIDRLNRICESWRNKSKLEGAEFPEDYIENCIEKGDLPPMVNAEITNYYFMVMQNSDGNIVGFFDLYHGYPDQDTLWIGIFLIEEKRQGKSYGSETIKSICDECEKAGWKSIGLGVHLKNWKALRFWNKHGFNKILGIFGDKDYSEHHYSVIGLKHEF